MSIGGPLLIEGLRDTHGRPASPVAASRRHAENQATTGVMLPYSRVFRGSDKYLVSSELDRAAYVALLLSQPLLLTGEPGAGKSAFARKIADILNLGEVEEAHVKTTTTGRDLLYSFDDVGRFRDATDKERTGHEPLAKYVRFNGLGRAILRSAGPDEEVELAGREVAEVLGRQLAPDEKLTLGLLFPLEFPDYKQGAGDDPAAGRTRSVVLIDEIDKAQRDTPNDLLDEIERMRFDIPELGITIKSSDTHWPIVIITSNAERSLPAPFLRRCVFHRLVTPGDTKILKTIIAARMSEGFSNSPAIDDVLRIFLDLRDSPVERAPGLSELLSWCLLLDRMKMIKSGNRLPRDTANTRLLEASLAALSKTEADFITAQAVLGRWRDDKVPAAP